MSFIWHSAQDQLYTPTPIGANRGPSRSHPDVAVLNRRIAVLEQTLKERAEAQEVQDYRFAVMQNDLEKAQQHIADLGDGMARAGPPMMVAFIDGEALTFAPHHIAQGHEGAQHCLDQLHTSIYAGMDMMGQQQREDAMEEGHSKPLLLLFYLYDQATMQAQLKHAGHPQAAAALPDFVSGLQDCVVLNAPTARRHERLLELLDVFGRAPNVRQLLLGGCAPPLHMRFWLQDTFTAANHPVLKKICLLTAPGNTSKFNDDSFTNLEASYYTRLVLSDLFTLLEPPRHSDSDNNSAAGKVAMFEDGDHTIGAGRPSSPGSRASFSSSTVSRLTERSDLKSSTSSVGWSLSPKPLEEEEEEDGQFDYLSASVRPKSKAGPARLTQSVDRRRTKTAPMPQRPASVSSDDGVASQSLTVPGMPGHQRATSANAALTRSRNQGITYAAFQKYESSGKKHPNFASPPRLDKSLPLSKQACPPCNNFYLSPRGCLNPGCKYTHSYRLSDAQLEELAKGARHAQCHFLKRGEVCPAGEDCIFGLHKRD